jgi:hypothetical protein
MSFGSFFMPTKRTDFRRARKALSEHLDTYHRALGAFVSAFSQVEATLLRALWILAKLKPPYAQAVLSGVKIEGAMGLINRIAEAEQWPESKKSQWEVVFSQLGIINKLRNDILHYGGAMFGDAWVISNRAVAHHPKRIREIHITPKILEDATTDLGLMNVRLVLLAGPKAGVIYPRRGGRRDLDRIMQHMPWLYKQPPQADWVRMLDEILQKQPPPRQPSRE